MKGSIFFHLIGFAVYFAVAGLFSTFSTTDPYIELSKTASSVAFGAAVVFGWSCVAQLKRIWSLYYQNHLGSIVVLLTTTFICGTAMISCIIIITNPSFRKDAFGVILSHSTYQEWLVAVPLLGYATVLPENFYLEKRDDVALVVSLFLMIAFGFLLQYDISMPLAILFLVLSWTCWLLSYYFLYKSYTKDNVLVYGEQTDRHDATNERIMLKRDLSIALALLLPVFPILYVLSACNILVNDSFLIAIFISNIFTKGLFTQTLLDSQLTLVRVNTEFSMLALETKRKQIFFKYVVREIGESVKIILVNAEDILRKLQLHHKNTNNDDIITITNHNNNDNITASNTGFDYCDSNINNSNVTFSPEIPEYGFMHDFNSHLQIVGRLIDDSLQNCRMLSSLEEKTFKLNKTTFKLHHLVKEIKDMCKIQCSQITLMDHVNEKLAYNSYIGDSKSILTFIIRLILQMNWLGGSDSNCPTISSSSAFSRLLYNDTNKIANKLESKTNQIIHFDVFIEDKYNTGINASTSSNADNIADDTSASVSGTNTQNHLREENGVYLRGRKRLRGERIHMMGTNMISNKQSKLKMPNVLTQADTDKIVFNISNEGESFTEIDIEDMFKPYSKLQGDGQHVDNSYYSSLKLAIGREIVLLHGGQIDISPKSKNGICNTISITIPFKKSTASFDGPKSGEDDAENPADMKNTYNVLDLVGTKLISPTDITLWYHILVIALYIIVAALFLNFLSFKDASFTLSHKSIFVAFGGAIVFGWSSVTQVKRIWSMHSKKLSLSILVLQTTTLMNAITMVSYLVTIAYPHYFHGDVFGVVIHHARYQGWLIGMPLLGYATVLPENGYLERIEDVGLVVSLFLTIAFSFILHYDKMLKPVAVLCLLSSGFFWVLSYYFLYKSFMKQNLSSMYLIASKNERLMLKRELSMDLALMLPVFPILYAVSAHEIIGADWLFIVCTIFEMITRGLLSQTVLDSQLTLVRVNTEYSMLEQESNRKHIFLKFLLHEIGIPLNAISMSTECIQSTITSPSTNSKQDILSLIDYTSEIYTSARLIDDSLRNCNIFTQLEEKTFQLNEIQFRLFDMTNEIIKTSKIQSKTLLLINRFDESIMHLDYIGDWYCIGLFIVYIILHMEKRNTTSSLSKLQKCARIDSSNDSPVQLDTQNSYHHSSNIESNWLSLINLEVSKQQEFVSHKESSIGDDSYRSSTRSNKLIEQMVNADTVVFTISNKGESYTEEEMTDMFEPYSKLQGDGQHVDNSYYSSLKLAIGREIVLLHGGRVDIFPKSNNGIRNVISITIPFKRCNASDINVNNNDAQVFPTIHEKSFLFPHIPISHNTPVSRPDRMKQADTNNTDSTTGAGAGIVGNSEEVLFTPSNVDDGMSGDSKNQNDNYMELRAMSTKWSQNANTGNNNGIGNGNNISNISITGNSNNSTNNSTDNSKNVIIVYTVNSNSIISNSNVIEVQVQPVQTKYTPNHLKVLIVDDTTSNRKMLQKLLQICSAESDSDTACDGKEAVDAVAEKSIGYYDIIFMDFTMPVMNGVEATRAIRDMGFKNSIIGVTANMMKEDFDMFYNAGADLVITKPMKKDMLKRILDCYNSTLDEGMKEIRIRLSNLK